jgi:hypothetical protein
MLPKSVEVILKLYRSSWDCCRSTWSNGGIIEHWRVTQWPPKLSLEQWSLTTENGDHSMELGKLFMKL